MARILRSKSWKKLENGPKRGYVDVDNEASVAREIKLISNRCYLAHITLYRCVLVAVQE